MDTSKLTALEFCILVLWVQGWTISKIHQSIARRHGKTENAVRGIINKMPKRRQEMKLRERQLFLEIMKRDRVDDGMLTADCFTARQLASDQKRKAVAVKAPKIVEKEEPVAEPDPKTRGGRRELKRRRREAELKRQAAVEEQARREAGGAPRGVNASPLEYLYHHLKKWIGNPEDANLKGGEANRANNAMRRYEAGVRLRSMMESIYGSGVKSQDFESAGGGGGGAGVVIHAVVAENVKNVHSIRSMMSPESFKLLEQMLTQGVFVWQMPIYGTMDDILADLRGALDKVSIFLGTMPAGDEEHVPRMANRGKIQRSTSAARDQFLKAARQAK